jgi:hypothetical protein
MAIRLRDGAALGDTAAIAATILQRRQDLAQSRADRQPHSRGSPSSRTRRSAILSRSRFPIWAPRSPAPRRLRQRHARAPEFAQFEATRARLASQEAVESAWIGRGLGVRTRRLWATRLDQLASGFQPYSRRLAVRVEAVDLGTTTRDRQVLELERQITTTTSAPSRTSWAAAYSRFSPR